MSIDMISPSLENHRIKWPSLDEVIKNALDQGRARAQKEREDLRDKFAMAALPAIPHMGCGADFDTYDLARCAYQIADAMMEARNK